MGHPEHGWANQPDGSGDGKALVGVGAAFRKLLNIPLVTISAMLAKGVKTISLIFHYPRTLDLESEQRRGSHSSLVT